MNFIAIRLMKVKMFRVRMTIRSQPVAMCMKIIEFTFTDAQGVDYSHFRSLN